MHYKPWHIAFWTIYIFLNALVNTAFAGATDLSYSALWRLLRFVFAELVVLGPSLVAAYWFIYRLVPRYFYSKKYAQLIGRSLLLLPPLVVLNRVLTYYVVFPALYSEYPSYAVVGVERLLYAFVDLLSAIGLFSTVQLLFSRQQEKQHQAELQQEKLESELRFLRAQTNPHFLFNTLNNIYALARKQSEQTAPVVLKLSKLLRFMLYECNTATIPLQREVQVIQDYIDLEKLRYNERLQVVFEVEMEETQVPVAPLLLLPFVENAFKHGAGETRFQTAVQLQLTQAKNQLYFQVRNTKDPDQSPNTEGIGLKNAERQLQLLYPDRHTLEVQDKGHQFEVTLILQL